LSERTPYLAQEILLKIADGDGDSFTVFYNQFKSRVFSIAYHFVKSPFLAEEVTQEVFVSIWVSRSGLRNVENIESYIYTSTYNKSLQHLKKAKNEQEILMWATQHAETPSSNSTENEIAFREARAALYAALELLPPQRKLIYRMSREQGLSNQEIAAMLNISPNTVKNHLVEAVRNLKLQLQHLPLTIALLQASENFL